MPKLIVAPLFEPLEDRVETFVGIPLQLPKYCNVAGITNLFRQVYRVEDELWLEIRILLNLRLGSLDLHQHQNP